VGEGKNCTVGENDQKFSPFFKKNKNGLARFLNISLFNHIKPSYLRTGMPVPYIQHSAASAVLIFF
jgi:hypothetical protein